MTDRVAQSADDLEFFEIALEYVASLNDTHSSFAMPSTFVAVLGSPSTSTMVGSSSTAVAAPLDYLAGILGREVFGMLIKAGRAHSRDAAFLRRAN